jgi:hypothetical protein
MLGEDPVASALVTFADSLTPGTSWEDSATELLRILNAQVDRDLRNRETWPADPRALGAHIARVDSELREVGILVERLRAKKHGGPRRIRIAHMQRQGGLFDDAKLLKQMESDGELEE